MRSLLILLTVAGAASAQSMVEAGALMGGATAGTYAGKVVSDSITSTMTKAKGSADSVGKTATAITGTNPQGGAAARVPMLQVGAGRVKTETKNEPHNVPLPPPPKRVVASRPSTPQRPVPIPVAYVEPEPAIEKPKLDVDLNTILEGTPRAEVLTKGDPSARITMFQDGHLVEIYSYRNATFPSGSVRLTDGAVSAIQVRP
jgi:hypothetical protein